MKNTKSILLALCVVFFLGKGTLQAQELKHAEYWTIENNIKDKTYTIVRFYNANDKLVKQQKLEKKYIKLNKRDIRRLNKALVAYNESLTEGEKYIAKRK
jgi:hypothetical protein